MGHKPGRTWGDVPSFVTDSHHKKKKKFKLFGLCFDDKLERNAIPPHRTGMDRRKDQDQKEGRTNGKSDTEKSTESRQMNDWKSGKKIGTEQRG
ncbi:hypothetical protein ElyMa_001803600 [Elysia marginata]|uniref:Uncharacterized protein n=1 Tax=Elysia marginata TaxID=1093978 RepID=A0AAV4EG14_9GAST|nr:hypothetical protein ElyMa_001803600 [Elysia marginata]